MNLQCQAGNQILCCAPLLMFDLDLGTALVSPQEQESGSGAA